MASNEAKIRFTAETGEFNSAIKQVDSSMRQLRSEMKLNAAQMASSGQSATLLANKKRILEQESQQLSAKEAALNAKLQAAVSIYGANSTEAQRLTTQINGVKAAQEAVRGKISQTTAAIEQQRAADAQAESAAGRLTTAIQRQQAELDQLKQRYTSAVIETGKEGTEARQLEARIRSLNSELQQNRAKLSEAEAAASQLTAEQNRLESAARSAGDGFSVAKGIISNFAADAAMLAIQKSKELAGDVVELGMTFETSLSKVQALSGATGDEMAMLEAKARELGSSTNFTASQVVDAFGYMALAGWDTQQSIDGIAGVLTLAQAGEMDLAAASDLLTDYLSAFSLQASDAAMMADVLAFAQGHANTNTEQLGQAFKNCAANCNAAGMDVQTTTAFISELSNQGLKGSEAGTALTAVMRDMTSKMKDGAIAVGDASVAVMDSSGNYRDMVDVMADVEAATNGMGDAERASALQATFTADSIKGLNLILNAGSGELGSFRSQLYDSSGAAEQMADVMTGNLGGDLAEMQSAFEEVGLKVYEGFQQPLRDAAQFVTGTVIPGITSLVSHFDQVGPAIAAAAAFIAAFAVAANIAPLLAAMQGSLAALSAGFAFLASPVGVAALAVGALAAVFAYLMSSSDEFRAAVLSAWDQIVVAVQSAMAVLEPYLSSAWTALQATVTTVLEYVVPYVQLAFSNLVAIAAPLLQGLLSLVTGTFGAMLSAVTGVMDGLVSIISGSLLVAQGIFETVIGLIVGIVTGDFSMMSDGVSTILTGLSSIASGALNALLSVVTGILNAVLSVFSSILNAVTGVVSGAFGGIASAVAEKMGTAQNVVSSALSAISGFFAGLHLEFPHINLPHFHISGSFSLDPPSVPSIGVEWYAKGGILTAPTIFGAAGGRLLGGGEAGPEAVLPIGMLQGFIDAALDRRPRAVSNTVNVTVNAQGDADDIANKVAYRVFGAIDQAMAANGR